MALEECFFVAIDWKFEKDEYRLKTNTEAQVDIFMSSGHEYATREKIRQLEPHIGNRV